MIGSELIGKRCMVRTCSAGVFFGTLTERDGREARVTNARRVHYWSGAASLSELAQRGTSDPANCRFPRAVTEVVLTEVIEVIPLTPQAESSLDAVAEWSR